MFLEGIDLERDGAAIGALDGLVFQVDGHLGIGAALGVAQFEALPDWEQSMIVSVLERVAGMLDAGTIDAAPVLTGGELLRNGRG